MHKVVYICTVDKHGYSDQKKTVSTDGTFPLETVIHCVGLAPFDFWWYSGAEMVLLRKGQNAALVSDVNTGERPLVLTGKPMQASKSKFLLLGTDILLQILQQCNRVMLFAVCRDTHHLILSSPKSDLALAVKSMLQPFAFFGVL